MTEAGYRNDLVRQGITKKPLPPSYRIIPRHYISIPLGTTPGDSRFCTRTDGYTVLYASPYLATAFIETVVRDRFARKHRREILLKEVTERAWVLVASKLDTKLNFLDLRGDGCIKLGAPTDAVNARSHAAGRALGRSIHSGHQAVDGFLFSSRLTGADVYAVFGRAITRLDVMDSGMLSAHPDIPQILSKYNISLMTS